MKFLIQFGQPVVYQAGHHQAQREVTQLVVHAPTARDAEIHAYRVCTGAIVDLTVAPFMGVLGSPPVEEAVVDLPITIQV